MVKGQTKSQPTKNASKKSIPAGGKQPPTSSMNKMDELMATVAATTPEVIGITESWGNDDISDSEFSVYVNPI